MEPVSDGDLALEKEKRFVLNRERVFYPGFYSYVQEVVRFNLLAVNADDPVEKALQLMLRERVKVLPVLQEGKTVGVIRSRKLFELLAKICTDNQVSYAF